MRFQICKSFVVGLLFIASTAFADTRIRFAVEYDPAIPPGIANLAFNKEIEKRSNGAIKVDYYGYGNLYKGQDLLQAVLRGDVQMTTLVSSHWIGVSPKLAVFELPFAFPDHEAFYRTVANREFMSKAFSEIEAKGAKIINVFVYDYAMITNSSRPVVTPADMKGLKLRAVGGMNTRTLQLLGSLATSINVSEVSVALERKLVDGMNTSADTLVTYKWDTILPYATDLRMLIFFYPWAVNAKWWNSLSAADQDLIQSTLKDVLVQQHADVKKRTQDSIATMIEHGVQVHKLTEEEERPWREATKVQWREAEEKYGKDFVDQLREASKPVAGRGG